VGSTLNELDAVRQLVAGNPAGLDALYARYATPAVRTAYLITRDRSLAEDAVQEAFVQVLRNAGSLRDPASFRPWFYRILVNTAKRMARTPLRPVLPLDLENHDRSDPTLPEPDEAVLAREETALVREAIDGLNEAHRIPLLLRYYTNLSDEEIAQALDLPVGTVKSRLFNARKLLQERLDGPARRERIAARAMHR
jgi:RNA polymerase sigma-70 factor (ECF subfamily)